jgi:phage tail sheath protein FI
MVTQPGVFVEEAGNALAPIMGGATSIAAFIGRTPAVPSDQPAGIKSFVEFERQFGGLHADFPLGYAVRDFFQNGGGDALIVRRGGAALASMEDFLGSRADGSGLYALANAPFNMLCIPPDTRHGDTPKEVYRAALDFCVERRAMLIVDAPAGWTGADDITANGNRKLNELGLTGTAARNAALYFPRVIAVDPLLGSQTDTFVPCGMIAGVIARTDATRGVWKAPTGIEASLNGAVALAVNLNDDQQGVLNPIGINCLRQFQGSGPVIWGARTLRGSEQANDEWKYVNVRRLTLFIEQSIEQGLSWTAFEPNGDPLFAKIRLLVGNFMQGLWRQGAFVGTTPAASYFVKCDGSTTTRDDTANGIVNIVVGFAPIRPAEFVVITIRLRAGQPPD